MPNIFDLSHVTVKFADAEMLFGLSSVPPHAELI